MSAYALTRATVVQDEDAAVFLVSARPVALAAHVVLGLSDPPVHGPVHAGAVVSSLGVTPQPLPGLPTWRAHARPRRSQVAQQYEEPPDP